MIGARFVFLSAAAAAALYGCAGGAPVRELRQGEQAIAQAQAAGAAQHAPAELALANEKLSLGKRWIAARDYEPAKWLVEQARVDAELAAMKSASAIAMRESARQAAELQATLRVIARAER